MNGVVRIVFFTLLVFALPTLASAAAIATTCGAPISSVTKTEIGTFETTSEQPVTLTGAGVALTVPSGTTRCVRIRFSAIANCPNACFLRAFAGSTEMDPAWVANPLRFSQDATNSGSAHAFEWVKRLGPGTYTIHIKIQTGNTCCTASIGPFTSVVELMR